MPLSQGEVVKILKGRRPSALVSKRLGFRSNIVYSWETSRRLMSWSQFVSFCRLVDEEFLDDFQRFFRIPGDLTNAPGLLQYFAGANPKSEIAKTIGLSKSKVSKLLNGQQAPSFEEVLKIATCTGGQVAAFFATQAKFANHPLSILLVNITNLFFAHPRGILVWTALDLEKYRKGLLDHAQMARLCGLDLAKQNFNLQEEREPAIARYNVFTGDRDARLEIQKATSEYLHRVGHIVEAAQKRPQTELLCLINLLCEWSPD